MQGHQTTGRTKNTAKNSSQGLDPEIPPRLTSTEQLLGFQLSLQAYTEGSDTCREQDKALLVNPGFF